MSLNQIMSVFAVSTSVLVTIVSAMKHSLNSGTLVHRGDFDGVGKEETLFLCRAVSKGSWSA